MPSSIPYETRCLIFGGPGDEPAADAYTTLRHAFEIELLAMVGRFNAAHGTEITMRHWHMLNARDQDQAKAENAPLLLGPWPGPVFEPIHRV